MGALKGWVVTASASIVASLAFASSASAATCASDVSCTFGVPFKTADGLTLSLDVYRPLGEADELPAVLAIHGGGFVRGTRDMMQVESEQLARDGFVTFAPDYRLGPCASACAELSGTAGYDDLYRDVRDALLWVRENGADYGADATRVGAFGTSAGAQLALRLNYQGSAGRGRADAAVGWSGPYVLDLRYYGVGLDEIDGAGTLAFEGSTLAGCAWGSSVECSERWIEQSDTTYVDDCGAPCDPPARLVMGLDEGTIDDEAQAEIMADVIADAGIESELRIYARGESCRTGVAPAPVSGCGGPGDCADSHAAFHGCIDPATGRSETETLADFFSRHLTGRVRSCRGEAATIVGTAGADRIRATADGDVIVARGGNDRVSGRGGGDLICGGGGADRLFGNEGRDTLRGGGGSDRVSGGPGRDDEGRS